jgi:menaquinone-dependent protoporphyrinogen oxidase
MRVTFFDRTVERMPDGGGVVNVVVVYASRYGSTKGIAEFIAGRLRERGLGAEAQSVDARPDPGRYDAVVLGSAVYLGRWMKDAVEFAQRNREVLAGRPVWLFSSGPLTLREGVTVDDPDVVPTDIAALGEALRPRDHRVFFGALDPGRLGFAQRAMRKLPAARAVLPEGDFRDWPQVEAWADGIAATLLAPPIP